MYYLIYWDIKTDRCITAKLPKKSDMDEFKEMLPEFDFIEVGSITYWLMTHGFKKLAMLPFWE